MTTHSVQSAREIYRFRLKRTAYRRNSLLAILTAGALLSGAGAALGASCLLWSTYAHTWTPYLKWQDAVLALLIYSALIALAGSAMIVRYLHALAMGYQQAMVTISENTLTMRDLSHKNLGSIFWIMGTTLLCFLVALAGLLPFMLMAWTQAWPDPVLSVLGTGLLVILSVPGVALSGSMIVILVCILVSSISLGRSIGAARTYRLNSHTSLWIHDLVLSILSPGEPESLLELTLLESADQQRLLAHLRTRWIAADRPWNPALGEEIEAALAEVRQLALSA
jgi:hypothetical protein